MGKPKSQVVQRIDEIQASVHSFLKPLGFHKKARAHNRVTNGGLKHVITFQLGQFPIGENYVIPGLRENFYGKFWVNLGVLLPCVYQAERQNSPAEFVQEYDCTIRDRLGALVSGKDQSFDLARDPATVAAEVVNLLDKVGLGFLEQFQTYQDVISYYDKHGNLPSKGANRSSLEIAIIAHHIENPALSKMSFAKAFAANHKGFQQYVVEIARRLGQTVG